MIIWQLAALPGFVVVEAAVDVVAASQQWMEPRCIGANARRRDADARPVGCAECSWKQLIASIADSQSTIFSELPAPIQKYPASLRVPGASPRQTRWTGATQLGADRTIGFPGHHQKDRVAAPVGIHLSRLDQRFQNARRKTTLLGKIATHPLEVGEIRHGQTE